MQWLNNTHAIITDNQENHGKRTQAVGNTQDVDIDTFKQAEAIRQSHPNMLYVIPTNTRLHLINEVPKATSSKGQDAQLDDPAPDNLKKCMQANKDPELPEYWGCQWDMHGDNSIHVDKAWDYIEKYHLLSPDQKPVNVAVLGGVLVDDAPTDIEQMTEDETSFNARFNFEGGNYTLIQNDFPEHNSDSHTTHIAGTIAAAGPKVMGVDGKFAEAFGLEYIQVVNHQVQHVGDIGLYGNDSWYSSFLLPLLAGIDWAIGTEAAQGFLPTPTEDNGVRANSHPARVLNMSIGLPKDPNWSQEDLDSVVNNICPAFNEVVERAHQKNATLVFAASNSSEDISNNIPIACQKMNSIVVGATNRDGNIASYSNTASTDTLNYTKNTFVNAPGGELDFDHPETYINGILSTISKKKYDFIDHISLSPGYGYRDGTSMAAPHVAGIAALLYAIKPDITWQEVAQVLSSSCSVDSPQGECIIDAAKAVTTVAPPTEQSEN